MIENAGKNGSDPIFVEFGGFSREAFAILNRIEREPNIARYRKERESINREIVEPFRLYRDDLVVNWVIPGRLDFETERNVFSRLLKNDFGAGGCHHHLWMSFYRPHLSRLKDIQLSHCIRPVGFSVELFVGAYAREPLKTAISAMEAFPETALQIINDLITKQDFELEWTVGSGKNQQTRCAAEPINELPAWDAATKSIRMRRLIPKDKVLNLGSRLIARSLVLVDQLWPLYQLWTSSQATEEDAGL